MKTDNIGCMWDSLDSSERITSESGNDPEVSGRGLCRHCVMNEEAVMLLKNERMRTKHMSPNVGFLLDQ